MCAPSSQNWGLDFFNDNVVSVLPIWFSGQISLMDERFLKIGYNEFKF